MVANAEKLKQIPVTQIEERIDKLYERIQFIAKLVDNLNNDSKIDKIERVKLNRQFSGELATLYVCIRMLKELIEE